MLCAMQGKCTIYPGMLLDCFQVLEIGKISKTVSDLIGASTHLA